MGPSPNVTNALKRSGRAARRLCAQKEDHVAMWGYREETAVSTLRGVDLFPVTSFLILVMRSRTVRNKFLLFKLLSAWLFCYSGISRLVYILHKLFQRQI